MRDWADPEVFPLPEYSRQPPVPYPHPPPVEGKLDELPFGLVDENQFEYLILDYLQTVRGWKDPQRYGEKGQGQDGIDLVDMEPSSAYPTCQVKRRKNFGPAALENAVEMWRNARPFGSDKFSLAVSRKLSSQAQRRLAELRNTDSSVSLDVIDAGVLNRDLRIHPELVERHFHHAWIGAFCDPKAVSRAGRLNARQRYLIDTRQASEHRERSRLLSVGVPEESLEIVIGLADTHYAQVVEQLAEQDLAVIQGPAGTGKSALLERVFRFRLDLASDDPKQPISVFILARGTPADLTTALDVADDAQSAKSLHIEGLDEVSLSRAQEIVAQVRSLMSLGRIAQATITRRRRESAEPDLPVHSIAELSEAEAEELMSAVAGRDVALHGIPHGSARKSVRLPLFAIVAGRLRSQNRTIPSSRAQFLVALTKSEMGKVEQDESLWEELVDFAALTVSQAGPVSRSDVGIDPKLTRLLQSRFVEDDGGALRFALPLLEQFFAAQALLEDRDRLARALSDPVQFETWREPLAIALALMPWNEVNHLTARSADLLPGAVWKLTGDAFSGPTNPQSAVPLPSEDECEDRIREGLSHVLQAVGPVRSLLGLASAGGEPLPVGVRVNDGRMAVAIWTPGSDRPMTKDTIHDGWRGPSDWSFEKIEPAHFAEQVWPVASAIEFVDRGLAPLLENVGFAVSNQDAAWPERRYEIARILADNPSLIAEPVLVDEIRDALDPLRQKGPGLDGLINYAYLSGQNRVPIRLLVWAEELDQFLQEFDDPTQAPEVANPWTPPDQLYGSGWTWGLWSEQAWLRLIEEVYQCALTSYGAIVDRWFSPLKPYLGIAGMWPVELRVRVGFMGENSGMPGCPTMSGRFVPLGPGAESVVTFTDESMRIAGDWSPPEHERELLDTHHPGALRWVRWPGIFQTIDVGCTGSAPALEIAYNWLIEDLSGLGVLSSSLTRQRRH